MQKDTNLEKVLILTYYWPPAGGPGVQRWLKFAKYLPQFGYQPVIYTPENPNYPLLDENLEQEIPKECVVLKKPISEPYKWGKMFAGQKVNTLSSGMIPDVKTQGLSDKAMLWIRGNFFIPDARVGWVKPSVDFLATYIKKEGIKTVISTGPPHSLHLIGLGLKRSGNVHWIADFRDPWTTIGYHSALKLTKLAKQKHLRLEREVLQEADQIIVTSKTTKTDFQKITAKPITTITNGYDVENVGKVMLDQSFSMAHIGSLLSDRNPRVLWKALKELRKENAEFKAHFKLKLIGRVSAEIQKAIAEFDLLSCTEFVGYVEHKQALIEQRKAQVLLLIEIDSEVTQAIIPGKLFEYMAAERPILAIGPDEADFFEIIRDTNTGKIARYDEKDKIKTIVLEYFQQYQEGNLKTYGMGLQYFSRKKLTERLVSILPKK